MNSRATIGLILAFCVSLGVHGVAYASLASGHAELPAPHPPTEISFEVKPLPEPSPEPEAQAPQAQPASIKTAAPSPQTLHPSAHVAALPAAPAATSALPLDLSGVTLTNDTGSGFAVPVGDGSALHGPITANDRRSAPAAAVRAATPQAPRLVAVGDLSEHPRPPALAGLLRANYPEEARQRGLRGDASVRAQIDRDGVIRAVRLRHESAPGFGSACRRTVLGSHWSAPRDKNGDAVATEIVYTCHFEVGQ